MPLLLVLIISGFLLTYLLQNKDPNKPPSALINQDMPEFKLTGLVETNKVLSNFDLKEKIIIINFFASWCAPCKVEHPLFFEIKKKYPNIYILGINYKDEKVDAINYLNKDGNPYDYVGIDNKGLIGLEFGVFGLPETFLINKNSKIIYKHLGPLTKKIIKNEIYAMLK